MEAEERGGDEEGREEERALAKPSGREQLHLKQKEQCTEACSVCEFESETLVASRCSQVCNKL